MAKKDEKTGAEAEQVAEVAAKATEANEAAGEVAEVVTKATEANIEARANELMKQNGVTKIWYTSGKGYWFTNYELASEHHKNAGGEVRGYEL